MFKGEPELSRARGVKAQRRQQYQQPMMMEENTISFHPVAKIQRRPINLLPKSRGQERLVLSLLNETTAITVAVGPAGTGKTYTAVALAVKAWKEKQIKRIILISPPYYFNQD